MCRKMSDQDVDECVADCGQRLTVLHIRQRPTQVGVGRLAQVRRDAPARIVEYLKKSRSMRIIADIGNGVASRREELPPAHIEPFRDTQFTANALEAPCQMADRP